MSSSVSSEHVFSQGGIMISKHRNCLKGDIVEVLQCIKSTIQHDSDLLFQCPAPSSKLEAEKHDKKLENISGGDSGNPEELNSDNLSWVDILIEDKDDDMAYWLE